MTGGHNKVEYCSGSHLKKSSFRSIDLFLALSLGRGLRRIVARVRGVLGAPPPKSSTVASHRCSNKPCITSARITEGQYFVKC